MSSVTKVEPKIQEIYTYAYRAMRQNNMSRYVRLACASPVPNAQMRSAVLCGLISWDNRASEFDGWLNSYRKRQFDKCKWNWHVRIHLPF